MLLEGIEITVIDEETSVICLELPPQKVVELQGVFELMEGTGIVRTLDAEQALICIITTPDMVSECVGVLCSLKDSVSWSVAQLPQGISFLEDFKKGCHD